MAPSLRIGIDVGGTFTDAVVVDSGTVAAAFKLPSTPDDPARAVIDALRTIAGRLRIEDATVFHGTTVGTNALIERGGRRTALVATRGFRDVIELRRQARPVLYGFEQLVSEPLVPPELRVEADERIAHDGTVVTPLADADRLVDALRSAGVESVAVCLLNAYANDAHERRIGERLRAALPGVFVTLSTEVAPEFREFERTSTTVVNAYIGPRVSRYVRDLRERAAEHGAGRLFIVKSNGGLTTPDTASRYPVHLIESGPAAALIASAAFGAAIGRRSVIAFDMGGTTAKAGVIVDGRPRLTTEFYADRLVDGREVGGFPIMSPVLDLVEIGAGGGSIAWLDAAGVLKVGPRSAGAAPGPACYGRGGALPTVTDAHAVIGTLIGRGLGESGVAFAPDLAREAIERHIARPKGWSLERAAWAIVDIAVANMAEMVRLATVRRGLDPRSFVLVASGGAGPLHAVAIAREVGIREIAIPPQPGMFSALGATLGQVRHDVGRTLLTNLRDLSPAALAEAFAALEARAAELLAADGESPDAARMHRRVDVRFAGQLFEIAVDLGSVDDPLPTPRALEALFREAYRKEYGFDLPRATAQLVNVRLTAEAGGVEPSGFFRAATARSIAKPGGSTHAILAADGSRVPTVLVDAAASSGEIAGPALIALGGSTAWLPEGARGRVSPDGALAITVASPEEVTA